METAPVPRHTTLSSPNSPVRAISPRVPFSLTTTLGNKRRLAWRKEGSAASIESLLLRFTWDFVQSFIQRQSRLAQTGAKSQQEKPVHRQNAALFSRWRQGKPR